MIRYFRRLRIKIKILNAMQFQPELVDVSFLGKHIWTLLISEKSRVRASLHVWCSFEDFIRNIIGKLFSLIKTGSKT